MKAITDFNVRRQQAIRDTPRRIVILAAAVATLSGAVSGVVGYVSGFSLGRSAPPIVIQAPNRCDGA